MRLCGREATMLKHTLSTLVVLAAGCSPEAIDKQGAAQSIVQKEGAVHFESLGAELLQGVFEARGQIIEFRAEPGQLTFKLRGLALILTEDPETHAFDLDGFDAVTGDEVAITPADK